MVDADREALAAPPELCDPAVWTDQPDVARYVAGGRVNISIRDIDYVALHR
jgi:hypothetical protein